MPVINIYAAALKSCTHFVFFLLQVNILVIFSLLLKRCW